jgi:glycosyltransferase involved in cell wall biosynthesis
LVPDDHRIRILCLGGYTGVGEKRNFGCAQARGELIAHWDDDDYSNPERLSDQVSRLLESGKAVTGYHSMRFTDGTHWWKYQGTPNYALGTSLVYRKEFWQANHFPALQVGEDNQFTEQASRQKELVTADGEEMMHATNHPGNTSPRMLGDNWKRL